MGYIGPMTDALRSAQLAGIKDHSQWLIYSSQRVLEYVSALQSKPDFESRALEAMVDAHMALVVATREVAAAIAQYSKKKNAA